jgi:hypothetical protein
MNAEHSHADFTKAPTKRALSLILCSRNDQYMGNSRWRLETTLNYVGKKVHELGREKEVEVLVADWGSEKPLHEVLQLSPAAARLVSFILIPPAIARDLQKDSPFPEVLALNAAARRAEGEYIGRIDQDTLVGSRFLKFFFELYENKRQLTTPTHSALLFSNLTVVPYRFAVRCPSFMMVAKFIDWFGQLLKLECRNPRAAFYSAGVGIWLLHRDLWDESGGYDEQMIYMNAMETNMVRRLLVRYKIVNLGKLVNYDFYHLEHYHPHTVRKSSTHRRVNPRFPFSQPDLLKPNDETWGLASYSLPTSDVVNINGNITAGRHYLFAFIPMLILIGMQMLRDNMIELSSRWWRRVGVGWQTIRHEPLRGWALLFERIFVDRNRQLIAGVDTPEPSRETQQKPFG